MDRLLDLQKLAAWLRWSNCLLGMNLLFDLSYLRAFHPLFALALCGRQHWVDLSVVNYLHNELRPEKSLKALGPILRTHLYRTTLRDYRFPSPSTPSPNGDTLLSYNASDPHNTVLAIRELALRILRDYPTSPKLSPYSQSFYSSTLWSVLSMTESGLALSPSTLTSLESRLTNLSDRASRLSQTLFSFPLSGPGSHKARPPFLSTIISEIDRCTPTPTTSLAPSTTPTSPPAASLTASLPAAPTTSFPSSSSPSPASSTPSLLSTTATASTPSSALNHPLLEFTDKKKELAFSDQNRTLLKSLLPPLHPLRNALSLVGVHQRANKILSSYTYPLLRHKRNSKKGQPDRASLLLPVEGEDVALSYPSWLIVPTSTKEGQGATGGTLQSRITCKNHSHQTDPPSIQDAYCSRWKRTGGLLLKLDLSQIELRVAALLSSCPSMVREYQKPSPDLHGDRAIQIFGLPYLISKYGESFRKVHAYSKATNGERQVGKHVNFADLFLSSPSTMQSTVLEISGLLYPLPFFEAIARSRPTIRPGLFAFQQRLIAEAHRVGYLCLPFIGQSRRFHGGSKYDVSEIVNFPIQTTASNTLLSLHNTLSLLSSPFRSSPSFLVTLNVYDALLIDCRDTSAALEAQSLIARALSIVEGEGYWSLLQSHYGTRIPLVAETHTVD